jgi:hypothetical protein
MNPELCMVSRPTRNHEKKNHAKNHDRFQIKMQKNQRKPKNDKYQDYED